MKNINPIVFAVSVVAVAGLSFFAGTKFSSNSFNRQVSFGNRQGQTSAISGQQVQRSVSGSRQMNGMNQSIGEITNIDGKTITIKLTDGSSKLVIVGDSTTVSQEAEATLSDLKTGVKIAVFGTTTTDGSVTAQNIQLNPTQKNQQQLPAGNIQPSK